ncbi:P4 family phage/plasmid primase-like protein [Nocardioides luteus]|uniref:SF3 helicase domain-containing protein n=1 Tax=Nocardioides luteus TaxID=1844 RepID=A0ABQ5SS86_9ACTN|nr:phage/plasmid primase, P4 family [Nocardioides luteus]MDR7310092.1 P4 family phage/plasmid primase-like protein [Nocardioides luteus]GGR64838.1 hypothetical protein GCM10010197_35390 [Nocardioides luteus]GLJ67000.1 hypothetical protein GCM10017579_10360 [Nocardioides luteus]
MTDIERDPAGNGGRGDYARFAIDMGWRPIALHGVNADGSCTCGEANCAPGKHPVNGGWQKAERLTKQDTYSVWDTESAPRNVGIATGDDSGFWVLDIDPKDGGNESLANLEARYAALPETWTHSTGSGGRHFLFKLPADFEVTNSRGRLKGDYPGIDVRGNGGQIVAPSSVTSKGTYATISQAPIADAPDWLLELIRPQAYAKALPVAGDTVEYEAMKPDEQASASRWLDAALRGEIQRLLDLKNAATPDGRNYRGEPWDETIHSVCCNLVELANSSWLPFGVEEIETILIEHAPTDANWTAANNAAKLRSAQATVGDKSRDMPADMVGGSWIDRAMGARRWEAADSSGSRPDDGAAIDTSWPKEGWDQEGNARRTVRLTDGRLLFADGTWYECLESGLWSAPSKRDGDTAAKWAGRAMRVAAERESGHYDDTPKRNDKGEEIPNSSQRDKFKQAMRPKVEMQNAVAALMRQDPETWRVNASVSEFDADPYLFACANGVIDLRTGARRELRPEDMIATASPIAHDPDMAIPTFRRFLETSHPDPEVRDFLQKALGYSLFNLTSERRMFIHQGDTTANGKSVLFNALLDILGGYASPAPAKALIKSTRGSGRIGQDIVDLQGPRLLVLNETNEGDTLDGEIIKGVTSGDPRTERAHYKGNTRIRITGKVHLVTNHLPHLTPDRATEVRVTVIPWTQSFIDNPDPMLEEKLRREYPGILAWLVEGARRWWEDYNSPETSTGLVEPGVSVAAKSMYFADEDDSAEWFDAYVIDATNEDRSTWATTTAIYSHYMQWRRLSDRSGIPLSDKAFGKRMTARGFDRVQAKRGGAKVHLRPVLLRPIQAIPAGATGM